MVLSIDEKSQIQALDRTAPILPMRPGLPEKATHDYVRHGTTTLFAALEVATGKVDRRLLPPAPHRRVPALPQAGRQGLPAGEAAHRRATTTPPTSTRPCTAWLARNPRITMHFTPTSGSWLNMVEIFFGIITRQAIRRGTFTSVKDLIAAIETLHRRLERTLPAVHLDQDRRRDPHQSNRRSKNIIHTTLGGTEKMTRWMSRKGNRRMDRAVCPGNRGRSAIVGDEGSPLLHRFSTRSPHELHPFATRVGTFPARDLHLSVLAVRGPCHGPERCPMFGSRNARDHGPCRARRRCLLSGSSSAATCSSSQPQGEE